jgi:Flp pilus assembly protein TadG
MCRHGRRRRRERGAFALEFALTVPYVILVFTMLFAYFQVLVARSLLFELARTATRTCMLRNADGSDMKPCLRNATSYLLNNKLKIACAGQPVNIDVDTAQVPNRLPGRQRGDLIIVTASCNLIADTPITVTGIASMPCISN